MLDDDQVTEYERRLIDRYTASELIELLDPEVELVIDRFHDEILNSRFLMEEVGLFSDDD